VRPRLGVLVYGRNTRRLPELQLEAALLGGFDQRGDGVAGIVERAGKAGAPSSPCRALVPMNDETRS
jgi:hypothetical protein